jgi:ribosomal protein S18 acetylase RimI-like enzyme
MLALSPLDQQRFGFPVAKGTLAKPAAGDSVARAARQLGAKLAIVRIPAELLGSAQSLEASGAIICDTLVCFRKVLGTLPAQTVPEGYTCSLGTPGDADRLTALARTAFSGYLGHYHSDRRLPVKVCDEIYASWAGRCCSDTVAADYVHVVRTTSGESHDAVAFAAIRRVLPDQMEITLNGVSPTHQGKGLYTFLIAEAQRGAIARHARELLVSTQVTNIPVQKVLCRAGFEPSGYFNTFHLWLDD